MQVVKCTWKWEFIFSKQGVHGHSDLCPYIQTSTVKTHKQMTTVTSKNPWDPLKSEVHFRNFFILCAWTSPQAEELINYIIKEALLELFFLASSKGNHLQVSPGQWLSTKCSGSSSNAPDQIHCNNDNCSFSVLIFLIAVHLFIYFLFPQVECRPKKNHQSHFSILYIIRNNFDNHIISLHDSIHQNSAKRVTQMSYPCSYVLYISMKVKNSKWSLWVLLDIKRWLCFVASKK